MTAFALDEVALHGGVVTALTKGGPLEVRLASVRGAEGRLHS